MYYLQSRYYDPAIGRFVNADTYASTGQNMLSNNVFTYCLNNPINSIDTQGTLTVSAFLGAVAGGAIAGALISTVSYAVSCGLNGESITSEGLIGSAISGAVSGAIGGAIGTISIGTKVVSIAQKIIPSATEKMLTVGAKAITSVAAGMFLSNGQTQQSIMMTSTTTSTFVGSMIDATTNSFLGSAFCNYAATLFVGTAVEVATVATKQITSNRDAASNSSSARKTSTNTRSRNGRKIPYQAARAMERNALFY